jgi:hypothetical protein
MFGEYARVAGDLQIYTGFKRSTKIANLPERIGAAVF